MAEASGFTPTEQRLLAVLPRIAAVISFLSALKIVVTVLRNRQYRSRFYHRLMLGTALNVMVLNILDFWGTAAVPTGTPGVYGAKGTTATCSAQGFLNQLGYVVPSYYCALSLYSFVAVRNNFVGNYIWFERCIHIGVYIYPVASGIYLLMIEAFNYSGHTCWVASAPLWCGNDSGVVCTRGPQNLGDILWLFVGAPLSIVLLVPTFVMVALYLEVRRKPYRYWIKAKTVLEQAGSYLLALYWTYLFAIINGGILFASGKTYFSLTLMAICVEIMIGLWIMLVYDHFCDVGVDLSTEITDRSKEEADRNGEDVKEGPREGGNADGNRRVVLHSIFDDTYATVEENSTQGVIARSPPHMQTINEVVETQRSTDRD
jgi:hypothetical protein